MRVERKSMPVINNDGAGKSDNAFPITANNLSENGVNILRFPAIDADLSSLSLKIDVAPWKKVFRSPVVSLQLSTMVGKKPSSVMLLPR